MSLFASNFLYSKEKSKYTCCLCEVHSVLKDKRCQYKPLFSCSKCMFTVPPPAAVSSLQHFNCQCMWALRSQRTDSVMLSKWSVNVSKSTWMPLCFMEIKRTLCRKYMFQAGMHVFQECRSHLKILRTRKVTQSNFQTKDPRCLKFSCHGDLAPIFCSAQLCVFQFSNPRFILFLCCSSWVWLSCCILIVSFVSGLCMVVECNNFFNGIHLLCLVSHINTHYSV